MHDIGPNLADDPAHPTGRPQVIQFVPGRIEVPLLRMVVDGPRQVVLVQTDEVDLIPPPREVVQISRDEVVD